MVRAGIRAGGQIRRDEGGPLAASALIGYAHPAKQGPIPVIPIHVQRDFFGRSQRWRVVRVGLRQQSRPSTIEGKSLLESNDPAAALAFAVHEPRCRNAYNCQPALANAKA